MKMFVHLHPQVNENLKQFFPFEASPRDLKKEKVVL
jgi:hypothetical protein